MKKFIVLVVLLGVALACCHKCDASITHNETKFGFSTLVEWDDFHVSSDDHAIKGRLVLYHQAIEKHWEGLATGTVCYRSNKNNYVMSFLVLLYDTKDKFEFDKSRKIVAHIGTQSFILKKGPYIKNNDQGYIIQSGVLDVTSMVAIIKAFDTDLSVYFIVPVKNSPDIIYKVEKEEATEWLEGISLYLNEVKRIQNYMDELGIQYGKPYKI